MNLHDLNVPFTLEPLIDSLYRYYVGSCPLSEVYLIHTTSRNVVCMLQLRDCWICIQVPER